MNRFGVTIVEGYGVTEASPVVAINKPKDNRRGTVGQLLPGLEARLEPVKSSEGCRLHLRGPNIMAGDLGQGGAIEPPEGGWYNTGDIVAIDSDGWVRILGRAKRFAKIGGEMVFDRGRGTDLRPLANGRHAVVSLSDPKRGERLVLVTDRQDAEPVRSWPTSRRRARPRSPRPGASSASMSCPRLARARPTMRLSSGRPRPTPSPGRSRTAVAAAPSCVYRKEFALRYFERLPG